MIPDKARNPSPGEAPLDRRFVNPGSVEKNTGSFPFSGFLHPAGRIVRAAGGGRRGSDRISDLNRQRV